MGTGFRGTFVISWSQTELDGLRGAPRDGLVAGAIWKWHGRAVCVDGPSDVLRLDGAVETEAVRRGAARKVRQLVGAAVSGRTDPFAIEVDTPLFEAGFRLTDGRRSYAATLIETGNAAMPLLMFQGHPPPAETDLWVVQVAQGSAEGAPRGAASGVICFTPGTRIETPEGPRPVQDLCAGDRVSTRDNGPQEIVWTGHRRMSGARLFAMPELRPVRFRPGALGIDRPDDTLVVSPDHRMLIRSPAVEALFDTSEVLVPARDLVDAGSVVVDRTLREVWYIHLLLPDHQVLWANGVECESFHPASADLSLLSEVDRQMLGDIDPALVCDPESYGGYARRVLSPAEAAILNHDAA